MPILATFCITRKLEQVIESHTMAIHGLVSSLAVVKIGYIMNIFYSLLRLAEQQGIFLWILTLSLHQRLYSCIF